jgi:hypothetical protein
VAKALAISIGLTETHKSGFVGRQGFAYDAYGGSLKCGRTAVRAGSQEVLQMEANNTEETYQGIVVPESVLLKREQASRYGSIEGLEDEELADPDELERQVFREEWAPILALPEPRRSSIRPAVDEDGRLDWGAFATVDFERSHGGFNKARYRAERLREELQDKFIMLAIVRQRLPREASSLVLKYLAKGIITTEHIVNEDMLALAKLYLQVRRKQAEIARLYEAGRRRREQQSERLLVRLG